jgi:hypothetical protein
LGINGKYRQLVATSTESKTMPNYHLAQVNIARLLVPEGDPQVAGFFDNLDQINTLAESSDGFIWRFVGDYDPDPMLLFNASVWESLEQLSQFVYRSDHVKIFRQRADWFKAMDSAAMALWWLDATAPHPDFDDAFERLAHLDKHGPTEVAFTFKQPFPAPTTQHVILDYSQLPTNDKIL